MPKVESKIANRAYPESGIKRGQRYWTWKFYRGRRIRSPKPPKPSQLTQREDYSELRLAIERIEELKWEEETPRSDLAEGVGDAITHLEAARDAAQGKFDNLPDQWQNGQPGEILQTFIDECDEAISELETIRDGLDDTSTLSFDEIDDASQISWPQET